MKHLIKIESTPHGVLGVRHTGLDQQYCEAGERVILEWQPDAKWGLQEAHYIDGDGNVTPIDLKRVKVNGKDVIVFTMPNTNITIGGTFKMFVSQDWTEGTNPSKGEVLTVGNNGEPTPISVDELANEIAEGDNNLVDSIDAINPFKGWYANLATLQASHPSPQVGDYAYVKGAESTDPAAIYECTTDGSWGDSGRTADTSNVQTFESGQEVNETYIDDTNLANPTDNALPTAADVLQLKVKLNGVTASETKVMTITDWHPSDKTSGYFKLNGTWFNSSNQMSTIIDVTGYKHVRFIGAIKDGTPPTNHPAWGFLDSDYTPITGTLTYYVYDNNLSEAKLVELSSSVPEGAKYLIACYKLFGIITIDTFYCYLQSGESIVELIENVDKKIPKTTTAYLAHRNHIGIENTATQIIGRTMLDTQVVIPGDWGTIDTLQVLNAVKKAYQQRSIVWKPKGLTIPKRITSTCTAQTPQTYLNTTDNPSLFNSEGNYRYGIPYTSNVMEYKTVGIEVSLETFMTAINNPYSVMYTENISKFNSQSVWNREYRNPNGGAYYGTVCCGFTSAVWDEYTKIHNGDVANFTRMFQKFVQVCPEGEVIPELIKIGDVADCAEHSVVITGIKKDTNGNVTNIRVHQSSGTGVGGQIFTLQEFKDLIANASNATGRLYTIFRPLNGWRNYGYEQSQFVTLLDFGETALPEYEYNNEICTIYGNKPCMIHGSLMVLNYNLDGEMDSSYDSIHVQKRKSDGTWEDVGGTNGYYPLSGANATLNGFTEAVSPSVDSINQPLQRPSQTNHAYVLGSNLEAGIYRACMSSSGTDSDKYTYWEIMPDDIVVTEKSDGLFEVGFGTDGETYAATNKAQMKFFYIGTPFNNLEDPYYTPLQLTYCGRDLTHIEVANNKIEEYLFDMLKDYGYGEGVNRHVRVILQGEFGMAATNAAIIPGTTDGEADYPDDDEIVD